MTVYFIIWRFKFLKRPFFHLVYSIIISQLTILQASNLIKAGYDVTVWNRSPDKCKPLEEKGAKVAESAKALIEKCDLVIAMLADPKAAEAVAENVAEGISEGELFIIHDFFLRVSLTLFLIRLQR